MEANYKKRMEQESKAREDGASVIISATAEEVVRQMAGVEASINDNSGEATFSPKSGAIPGATGTFAVELSYCDSGRASKRKFVVSEWSSQVRSLSYDRAEKLGAAATVQELVIKLKEVISQKMSEEKREVARKTHDAEKLVHIKARLGRIAKQEGTSDGLKAALAEASIHSGNYGKVVVKVQASQNADLRLELEEVEGTKAYKVKRLQIEEGYRDGSYTMEAALFTAEYLREGLETVQEDW